MFWNVFDLLIQIKSVAHHVPDFIKFVKLNRSQNSSNLSSSLPATFTSLFKSHKMIMERLFIRTRVYAARIKTIQQLNKTVSHDLLVKTMSTSSTNCQGSNFIWKFSRLKLDDCNRRTTGEIIKTTLVWNWKKYLSPPVCPYLK